jgi:hypothetical protein
MVFIHPNHLPNLPSPLPTAAAPNHQAMTGTVSGQGNEVYIPSHQDIIKLYNDLLTKAMEKGQTKIENFKKKRKQETFRLQTATQESQRLTFYGRRDGSPPSLIHDLERTQGQISDLQFEINRLNDEITYFENFFTPVNLMA